MSFVKSSNTPLLTSLATWPAWQAAIKAMADTYDVQEYVHDYDRGTGKLVQALTVLRKPQLNDYRTQIQQELNDDIHNAFDMDTGQRLSYKIDLEAWRDDFQEIKAQVKALKELKAFMISTVDVRIVDQISDFDTCREVSQHLKGQYAPSDRSRKEEIRRNYAVLQEAVFLSNLEHWLNDWIIMEK